MTTSKLKHLTRFMRGAFAVMLLMMSLSCSKSGSEIVGMWDNVKAPEIVEFKQDGSGVFTYPNSQTPPLAFSWKQGVNKSYIMDINFMGTKRTLTVTMKDSNLNIESEMGKESYRKHISH